MAGKLIDKKSGSWGVKNGLGFLFLVVVVALLITILIWCSDLPWKGVVLVLFTLLVVFLLFVGQQISCLFDVDRRLIYLRQQKIWK